MEGARRGGSVPATMTTECGNCGHRLWAEVRSAGAFRFVAHFDGDERSDTYAEHTPFCPGCGGSLDLGISGLVTAAIHRTS